MLNQRDVSLKIAARHPAGVLLIWAAAYIGMQTFAIPGTISLSLLAGALWGVHRAAIVVAMVSTAGACSCYMLSQLIGRPLAAALWPGKLQSYGEEVAKRRAQLLNYIIFLRVTPLLPNTFVNVASPIVGVPLAPFALGTDAQLLFKFQKQKNTAAIFLCEYLKVNNYLFCRDAAGMPSEQPVCGELRQPAG